MNRSIQKSVTYHVARTLTASQKRNTIFNNILEADDDGSSNKLKVLIDGDGMKLLMDIYQDYVSDDDYVEFPKFMRDVDNLLLNARGGKPLTREERENFEDKPATTKRAKKKAKKKKSVESPPENLPVPDATKEITSSDNKRATSISRFVARTRQNTLRAA